MDIEKLLNTLSAIYAQRGIGLKVTVHKENGKCVKAEREEMDQ